MCRGPLPQDLEYHLFADTRIFLHSIPHAGDVLTNLTILAAGAYGWAVRRRLVLTTNERAALNLLLLATPLMAFGSMYYHWNPNNDTLVWDRLPMMLTLTSVLALVLADRVHPLYARYALWPATLYAAATVLFWKWSETVGVGDLWPYGTVRFGTLLLIAWLFWQQKPRYTNALAVVVAVVLQIPAVIFELRDRPIWSVTRGVVSGHNVKHVIVGVSMALVFGWLRHRTALRATTAL
jgi:hypothetical protein